MSFEVAVVTCFQKYADIRGRASRSEYWWFQAFLFLMAFSVGLIVSLSPLVGGLLSIAVALGFVVPSISVTVRRMHDVGWSGAWLLLYLMPFGALAVFVITLLPSALKTNRWGPPPGQQVAPLGDDYRATRIPVVRNRNRRP